MLTSWRLCNFKSVTDQTELDLQPLTIFTGANSAGKSTIIQSMLLTAQTVQSSVLSRPVVLNGHMARLGSYTDIVSGGDEEQKISIGFNIRTDYQIGRSASSPGRSWHPVLFRPGTSVQSVSADYSFSILAGTDESYDRGLRRLQPGLAESRIQVAYVREGKVEQDYVLVARSNESVWTRLGKLRLADSELQEESLDALKYEVAKAPRLPGYAGRLEGLGLSVDLVGAYMQHFLPRSFSARFDEVSAQLNWQVALLTEPTSYRRQFGRHFSDDIIPPAAAETIQHALKPLLSGTSESPTLQTYARKHLEGVLDTLIKTRKLEPFVADLRRIPPRDLSLIYSTLGAEKPRLTTALRAGRPARFDLEVQFPSDQLSYGMDFIQGFFSSSVKYLGPLRDEPKPVYPLAGNTDPRDVGFRGEHTAAVLDVHRNSLVDYIPSEQFQSEWITLKPEKSSLSVAVQDWLEYMGVGSDFFTSDLGKLGHELKVKTEGSDLQHDLTQVGVGVSQVLPILVLALLAEAGSTLIFEQPELHLHPKVQSRLADFFLAMTALGKQCILETHSEYIINRLRLRAASEVGSNISNSSIIYFVEKMGPRSIYRRVNVDELGGLNDWPKGFFDEGELATTALLRQGLKKRKLGPQ